MQVIAQLFFKPFLLCTFLNFLVLLRSFLLLFHVKLNKERKNEVNPFSKTFYRDSLYLNHTATLSFVIYECLRTYLTFIVELLVVVVLPGRKIRQWETAQFQ